MVKKVTAAATIIKNPGAISFPVRATSHDATSGVSPPITPRDICNPELRPCSAPGEVRLPPKWRAVCLHRDPLSVPDPIARAAQATLMDGLKARIAAARRKSPETLRRGAAVYVRTGPSASPT